MVSYIEFAYTTTNFALRGGFLRRYFPTNLTPLCTWQGILAQDEVRQVRGIKIEFRKST